MNRVIRRIFMSLLFIMINLIILMVLGSIYYQFNSGADRGTIFHESKTAISNCNPNIVIKEQKALKTIPTPSQLAQIKNDYVQSWCTRYYALRVNDVNPLRDYYTDSSQVKLARAISYNKTHNITIDGATLEHNITFDFFSADGQFAVFTDREVLEVQRLYHNNTFQTEERVRNTYKVIMLLEDGFWRIRDIIAQTAELIPETPIVTKTALQEHIKGINYYPKDSPWLTFWTNYNEQVVASDFERINDLGFNTIRIFIPYKLFGGETVIPKYLAHLETTLVIAKDNHLKVIPTFFDFYGSYNVNTYAACDAHIKTIVTRLANNETVHHYDIKNEPDLDFENAGKNEVLNWLQYTASRIKYHDINAKVTIGWSNIHEAIHLHEIVDYVSFHHYHAPEKLSAPFKTLQGITDKPLVLQEFGVHSYNAFWFPFSNTEYAQAKYFERINDQFEILGLQHKMNWTLYDYTAIDDDVFGSLPHKVKPQQHFGILDENGNKKLAAEVVTKNSKAKFIMTKAINAFYLCCILLFSLLILFWKLRKRLK